MHQSISVRNLLRGSFLFFLALGLAACDPCFGTSACTEPHFSGGGRLVWHLGGEPAEGVRVLFVPTDGVFATRDTATAVSDDAGNFVVRLPATEPGTVTGTLIFFPPPPYEFFPFSVRGVSASTTSVDGDIRFLGEWGVGPLPGPPQLRYLGELYFEDTGARASGVEVEFRRTGGIAVRPDTVVVSTGGDGRFPLFLAPSGSGSVRGELHIRPPAPYEPRVIPVELTTTIAQNHVRLLGVWPIFRP